MARQRLSGLVLIAVSVIVLLVASTGKTVLDSDCTAIFITIPAGLYLLFTKHIA